MFHESAREGGHHVAGEPAQLIHERGGGLSADGKGEGATRFERLIRLSSPVFSGVPATGALVWGLVFLLGWIGDALLWWFPGHLALVEWLMLR